MKCKECKSKFIPKYFNQKYCLINDECIKAHVENVKSKQTIQKKKENKAKLNDLQPKGYWLGKLQEEINQIVRLIDKDCPCISSGRPYRTDDQAGHFYSVGSTPAFRFNLLNIWGQSIKDNYYQSANLLKYRNTLVKFDIIDLIEDEKRKYPTLKLSIEEIKEAILKAKIVKKLMIDKNNDVFAPRSVQNRVNLRVEFNRYLEIYKA